MEYFQASQKLTKNNADYQNRDISTDIYHKRDKFRIQIRKQQMDKIKRRTRSYFKFKKSQTQILLDIDCNSVLKDLKTVQEMNKLQQIVHNIFIYATSTEAEHIFNMFDEDIVSRLIIIIHENIHRLNSKQHQNEQSNQNQVIEKMMKQSLWILTNFTSLNYNFHQFIQYIDLLSHLITKNSKQIIELCLLSLGNLCDSSLHKQKILSNQQLVEQIVKKIDHSEQFKDEGIYFIMKLFDGINLKYAKNEIYIFFKKVISELGKSTDNTQIKNIIQAIDDFFSEDNIKQNPKVLLTYNHQIYSIVNWLLQQKSANIFQKQQKLVLNILNRLYLTQFQDQQIDKQYEQLILKHILENYLFKIYNKYQYHNNQKIKRALYQIFQNVCATQCLLYILFDKNLFLDHFILHLDVNIFDINLMILGALCNLCILGQQYQIQLLINKNILQIFAHRLYTYQDNQLNSKILEALKVIFEIGRYNKQQNQYAQNLYLKKFIYFGGLKKLEEISHHQNAKLSRLANDILEQYADEIQYSKNDQQ